MAPKWSGGQSPVRRLGSTGDRREAPMSPAARSKLKERIRRMLPSTVRPHSILAGPLRGAKLYTSWYDYPGAILGTTELPLLEWFARNVQPGETWIDVGAHYGYTAIALCRLVGAPGRVVAFEPV